MVFSSALKASLVIWCASSMMKTLVPVARRLIAHVLAQLAHFVDAAIGGGVDFDHVHGAPGRDFLAARADPAGHIRGAVHAVEAAGQDARHGGLAGSALPREDVAVRDAILRDGVLERGLDVLLIHHVGERLGPVFPGDDLVHGWANARPRVIRGTQVKPLPLLPSGPGGVCSRLSHGARDLTIDYRITRSPVILIIDARSHAAPPPPLQPAERNVGPGVAPSHTTGPGRAKWKRPRRTRSRSTIPTATCAPAMRARAAFAIRFTPARSSSITICGAASRHARGDRGSPRPADRRRPSRVSAAWVAFHRGTI
jgi:hypothetical protein